MVLAPVQYARQLALPQLSQPNFYTLRTKAQLFGSLAYAQQTYTFFAQARCLPQRIGVECFAIMLCHHA
jgi:hypothetical protein